MIKNLMFPRPSYWSRIKAIKILHENGVVCCDIEWHLLPNGWVQAEPI